MLPFALKQNRLLAAIPESEYAQLLPHLESMTLEFKQTLYKPHEPIEFVYFPLTGVVSLLTLVETNMMIEVGTVGNEGMVGMPIVLGTAQVPGLAIAQVVPGSATRINVAEFQRQVVSGTVLYQLLHRYAQVLFNQIAQTAACNRVHSIQERFCRWILMTHDRVDSDQFILTQEFLGQMLGIRRGSVNKVAAAAQRAGLIEYNRGKITILDRQGLEATSCDCYRIIRQEFDRLALEEDSGQ